MSPPRALSFATPTLLRYRQRPALGHTRAPAPRRLRSPPRHAQHSQTPMCKTLTFIGGGGKMASALIKGLQAATGTDANAPTILASSPRLGALEHLGLPAEQTTTNNLEAARAADVIFLCVKPPVAPKVLGEIGPALAEPSPPLLLSVVAGLTTAQLATYVGDARDLPIVRAMPNLAAGVSASATAMCASESTSAAQLAEAEALLRPVGAVSVVPEELFSAMTAVAGCGAAYVFMLTEALADAGVRHGLTRSVALRVAAQTVAGAGMLAAQEDAPHPAVLRNSVESPGGVTVAATAALERAGLRAAMLDAVDAAVARTREIGEL